MFPLLIVVVVGMVVGSHGYAIGNETATMSTSCSLRISNLNDVARPTPLLVYPGTTRTVRASNAAGLLTFSANEGVRLACTGSNNFISVLGAGNQEANALCVSGTTFRVNNVNYQFSRLTCQRWPVHVNFNSGATCLWGRTLVKSGFQISAGFVDLYDTCHDTQQHHTFYTKFVLGRDVAGFQTGAPRPDWEQGNFFRGLDPTNLYRRATQRITFTQLLGSQALAEEKIHMTNDYFLSKGHLVARADFLQSSAQMATFWYTNAAPQWQTFNGNNWNALENDARSLAARLSTDLDVYTGTYGRATLTDINNNYVELFLTTIRQMPVPRMFWKILYDPITQLGTAFIGLNNPYQSTASVAQDIRCRDICSTINWLSWRQFDVSRGYSYCCEVNDFRANFPDIPTFPVRGILR